MHLIGCIFIYLNLVLFINSQNLNKIVTCNNKVTCSECIQDGCIWCSKIEDPKKGSVSFTRCIEESTKTAEWCPDSFVKRTKSNKLIILKDHDLTQGINHDDSIIQIRPQKVQLKLRLNEGKVLDFQYAQAIDYPVDLYYLMDISSSMSKYKNTVSELGDKLVIAMQNLTKNFHLGFGSSLDKVAFPFASRKAPSNLKVPLTTPYSFRNNLKLQHNATLFKETVKNTKSSYNIDNPEGGFDAILQAIVCEEPIGWRKNATRLLVFSTDALFHQAGDGKLIGVIEPHDGNCYLNKDGDYTHSLKFDYPSIALLNYYVKKQNIDLIFAVSEKVVNDYIEVQQRIEGSQIAILSSDTDKVANLVMDKYKNLKQSVIIIDNATSDVYIEYLASCTAGEKYTKTKECRNIRYNSTVNFRAIIKATSCKKKNHIIEIRPRSLSESLIVELELQCDCDCEQPGHKEYEENSRNCSMAGDLKCGICNCNPGRFGKFCECDENAGITTADRCKMKETDEFPCSNHGTCICDKCKCDKGPEQLEYSGDYCQCDPLKCIKSNKECSGNGKCDCNQCKCNPGFSGQFCECDNRGQSCMAPGTQEICSGKGKCNCGECLCHKHPILYWGQYCEICSNCAGQRCSEFVDCVKCKAFPNTGQYSKNECSIYCTNVSVQIVDNNIEKHNDIEQVLLSDNDRFKYCEHINDNECTVLFEYTYDSKQKMTSIRVQKYEVCPRKISLLYIILMVSGTILLGGMIMLLIWKICTEVHDRHEFTRFENERMNANWISDDNPLFKAAVTTVNNPMFNKRISKC